MRRFVLVVCLSLVSAPVFAGVAEPEKEPEKKEPEKEPEKKEPEKKAEKKKSKSKNEYHGPYSSPPGYPGQGWVRKKK
ncbi:MAG: hypothetical protein IT381_23770 [Deltaproteobacteria bacterium]|nr:hypothetical protein [Deltaproteobacteria bacterium]